MTLTENGIKVLDIAVKGVFGTVIVALVAIYGNTLQNERETVEEQNRTLRATVDLTSRQKEFDMEVGMRLFGTLLTSYFQRNPSAPRPETLRQQMLLLRLVALNFQDVPINLKPLFEDLDSQLPAREGKEKQVLREIAKEVANRQAYRLTVDDGYDSGPRKVKAGDELAFPNLLTTVKIETVGAPGVRVRLSSKIIGDHSVGFTIGHFDTPLVDNIKLGESRVALILNQSTTDTAEVRFVAFPKHLAADRFDIKEVSRYFRDTKPR